jgi:hypothetical protein
LKLAEERDYSLQVYSSPKYDTYSKQDQNSDELREPTNSVGNIYSSTERGEVSSFLIHHVIEAKLKFHTPGSPLSKDFELGVAKMLDISQGRVKLIRLRACPDDESFYCSIFTIIDTYENEESTNKKHQMTSGEAIDLFTSKYYLNEVSELLAVGISIQDIVVKAGNNVFVEDEFFGHYQGNQVHSDAVVLSMPLGIIICTMAFVAAIH